jgi:hypothetical protein
MAAFFRDLERLAYALLIQKSGINDRIDRFSKLTGAIIKAPELLPCRSLLRPRLLCRRLNICSSCAWQANFASTPASAKVRAADRVVLAATEAYMTIAIRASSPW